MDFKKINDDSRHLLVEANIGAGKTTFIDSFTPYSNIVEIIPEPVEQWKNLNGYNLLEKMYRNPLQNAMTTESYILLTMAKNHTAKQVKPLTVMERSIFSTRFCFIENMYKRNKMEESEYLVLDEWFQYVVKNAQFSINVDQIIYLRTDPEIAFERIQNRNRKEERNITLQYIRDLHQLHERWLFEQKDYITNVPVKVIDANGSLESLQPIYNGIRNDLLQQYIP